MTNSLDDIFSPERLRHRWQQDEVPAEKQEQADVKPDEPEDAMAVFRRLQSRIQERFPGEQGQPLALSMNELEELLLRRFPQTEDVSGNHVAEARQENAAAQQRRTPSRPYIARCLVVWPTYRTFSPSPVKHRRRYCRAKRRTETRRRPNLSE